MDLLNRTWRHAELLCKNTNMTCVEYLKVFTLRFVHISQPNIIFTGRKLELPILTATHEAWEPVLPIVSISYTCLHGILTHVQLITCLYMCLFVFSTANLTVHNQNALVFCSAKEKIHKFCFLCRPGKLDKKVFTAMIRINLKYNRKIRFSTLTKLKL